MFGKNGKVAYALIGKEREQVAVMANQALAAQQAFASVIGMIGQREGVDLQKYAFNQVLLRFEAVPESPKDSAGAVAKG